MNIIKVSDQDQWILSSFDWYVNQGHVVRWDRTGEKDRLVGLHRQIMGDPSGMVVDHINGNGLDNRRENLRVCTQGQNLLNRSIHKNNACGYPNVYFERARGSRKASFTAQVTFGGVKHRRSGFATAQAAFQVAQTLLVEHHGEFSKTGRPDVAALSKGDYA